MKNEIEELSKRMAATEEKIKEMRKLLDAIAEKMSKSYFWSSSAR